MKNLQTLTLSKKKYTFQILDSIEVEINVTENPYHLPIEELFTMAARINKKRSFLFVSKVLGKHIAINAKTGLLTAALLAVRFSEKVKGMECLERERLLTLFSMKEPPFSTHPFIAKDVTPLVIGFAETATALGHAFFDCFQAAEYFHTTREGPFDRKPEITFEEEHSHATSHRCYIPREMIENEREIILVDDEMTTGKTAINIIQSIQAQFPRQEYTVVSILDWRSEENQQKFKQLEKKLGITIRVVCLIAGQVSVRQTQPIKGQFASMEQIENFHSSTETIHLSSLYSATHFSQANQAPFIEETGRFGLRSTQNQSINQKISASAALLRQKRTGTKTLCLGTGEFMYIPMRLATEMGKNVFYQSTTRSPIYIENKDGYGVRHGIAFANPEDQTISHFVYNIPPGYYDEIFLFFEREVEYQNLQPLLKELEKLQLNSIKIVFFSGGEQNARND